MYNKNKRRFSKRKGSVYLLTILLLALFLFISIFLNKGIELYGNNLSKSFEEEDLNRLWEERKYSQIVTTCEEVLEENFLDLNYLCFHGFANFYLGISQISLEMKIPLINQSIISLRKAFILADGKLKGDIAYVLGKAYYYKGKSFSDLTIKYLNIALNEGYLGKDIYEFKGLAYYELGQYDKSIIEFEALPVEKHSPEIMHIISQAYGRSGNFLKQEEILVDILNNSSQRDVRTNSSLDLASLYFDKEDYQKAIVQANEVLKWRADEYEAQFILGKSLYMVGEKADAKKVFRKILKQKPGDKEALSWLKR